MKHINEFIINKSNLSQYKTKRNIKIIGEVGAVFEWVLQGSFEDSGNARESAGFDEGAVLSCEGFGGAGYGDF